MRKKFYGDGLDGSEARLYCPKCAAKFQVDACTEENLIQKKNAKGRTELFAKCPKCGEEEQP